MHLLCFVILNDLFDEDLKFLRIEHSWQHCNTNCATRSVEMWLNSLSHVALEGWEGRKRKRKGRKGVREEDNKNCYRNNFKEPFSLEKWIMVTRKETSCSRFRNNVSKVYDFIRSRLLWGAGNVWLRFLMKRTCNLIPVSLCRYLMFRTCGAKGQCWKFVAYSLHGAESFLSSWLACS